MDHDASFSPSQLSITTYSGHLSISDNPTLRKRSRRSIDYNYPLWLIA